MKGEIVVPEIVETKSYGDKLLPSFIGFDIKSGTVKVIFETHDGNKYTAKYLEVSATVLGSDFKKVDDTKILGDSLTAADLEACLDLNALVALIQKHAG